MKYRALVLSMLFVLPPSCGWQLRDTQLVPSAIGTLYLSSSDRNSALITELERALNINGIKVIGDKARADYSVIIVDYRQNSRTASINPSGRVAEYQLNEDVDFIIADGQGNEMIPCQQHQWKEFMNLTKTIYFPHLMNQDQSEIACTKKLFARS